jgi:flavodoxin
VYSGNVWPEIMLIMKTLVVRDSQFGNTRRVTQIIAETLQLTDMLNVDQAAPQQLSGLELLMVGSPTRA